MHALLRNATQVAIPPEPGRDIAILPIARLPAKAGLSTIEGQARLLHDLASIEMQAMELGLRTLAEFPAAPSEFRQELAALTLDEARHLRLCHERLKEMGFCWGHWPAHLGLWQAVDPGDSFQRRVLLVHRYLEGSGLDAGSSILRRLSGVQASGVQARAVQDVVQIIVREEIGHVAFGSRWFHKICNQYGLDADQVFRHEWKEISQRVRRHERPDLQLREQAGFTAVELGIVSQLVQA